MVAVVGVFVELIAIERLMRSGIGSERMRAWTSRAAIFLAAVSVMVGVHFAVELQEQWRTFGWSIGGLTLMGLGFLWNERDYRRTGLGVFVLSLLSLSIDILQLELVYRMMAFMSLGACMLAVSYLYSRYRERLQRWL
jgi:uncharacterized membrane protein